MTALPSVLTQATFTNIATEAIQAERSLGQVLLDVCRRRADQVALSSLGRDFSYGELADQSACLAAYLRHHLKLPVGSRVALMLPNLLNFPITMLAVIRADLVLVPVNPLYTARELAHQLKDAGAEVLIVLEQFAEVVAAALPGTAVTQVIVCAVGDLMPWPKSMLMNLVVRHVKKQVPPYRLPNAVRWAEAIRIGRSLPVPDSHAKACDTMQLQYTGGTTGLSKGATLSHNALLANAAGLEQWMGPLLQAGRVSLIALPVYHIAAYSNLLIILLHGVRGVLLPNARDLPALVAAYARYRPDVFAGVNTLFDAILNNAQFQQCDHSNLKLSIQGGTALRRATAERWRALTGCRISEMYGLSETSAGITGNRWDADNPTGSIGLTLPGIEASIRNEAGEVLPVGEVGELCVRGAALFTDYWQHPDETAKAHFDDGWFRTGDIGRQDAAGYLYILDRRKDMILVSGFNVFPNEIEDVVALHPGVLEAAAVAVPDDKTGEAIKLVVVRRDPALDEDSIRAHCRAQLTGYKQPKSIEFRDSLPKSAVGKVLRRELRA
ncbi:long-chain-fatty-acid--CoA ligase [Ahniella affigens]|uniref:Long-chain-fatty-acid--CoA ligase n=2 Tax=Ahniella affigens TaxID=2021234 RepID=A0A2P1PXR5_9GAMM|nr:long-chain-fatty-acid--CoA ligase [Ahniella affigens]